MRQIKKKEKRPIEERKDRKTTDSREKRQRSMTETAKSEERRE